ncbi:hypothetical protein BgiBS90_029820 [Biomphalaria glabrata]|nr:hypothetical protein BgiBS90_029820 [Biomphalaria glabrata]
MRIRAQIKSSIQFKAQVLAKTCPAYSSRPRSWRRHVQHTVQGPGPEVLAKTCTAYSSRPRSWRRHVQHKVQGPGPGDDMSSIQFKAQVLAMTCPAYSSRPRSWR